MSAIDHASRYRPCRCALYRMIVLHVIVTAQPQIVYRAVYVDWKITVKGALSRKRGHLRQIGVGHLTNIAKSLLPL